MQLYHSDIISKMK